MGGQCRLNVALMNDQSMVSQRDWSEPLTVQFKNIGLGWLECACQG